MSFTQRRAYQPVAARRTWRGLADGPDGVPGRMEPISAVRRGNFGRSVSAATADAAADVHMRDQAVAGCRQTHPAPPGPLIGLVGVAHNGLVIVRTGRDPTAPPVRRLIHPSGNDRGRGARPGLGWFCSGTAYDFVAQKIFGELVDRVQELLTLRGVLALLRRAGELRRVPELLVQVGVRLQVLGLEVVGPQHPQVMLHQVRALLLDGHGAVLEDRVVASPGTSPDRPSRTPLRCGPAPGRTRRTEDRSGRGRCACGLSNASRMDMPPPSDGPIRKPTTEVGNRSGASGRGRGGGRTSRGHACAGNHRASAIEGGSMAPTLLPGDWALAIPLRHPKVGDVVVVEHPDRPGYEMVKRIAAARRETCREIGRWAPTSGGSRETLASASTDSRQFGPVPAVCPEGEGRADLLAEASAAGACSRPSRNPDLSWNRPPADAKVKVTDHARRT